MHPPTSSGDVEAAEQSEDLEAKLLPMTQQHLESEEAEIRELERKKKGLEERVAGMERDLGGLMR